MQDPKLALLRRKRMQSVLIHSDYFFIQHDFNGKLNQTTQHWYTAIKIVNYEDGVPQYRLQSAAARVRALGRLKTPLPTEVGTAEHHRSMLLMILDVPMLCDLI